MEFPPQVEMFFLACGPQSHPHLGKATSLPPFQFNGIAVIICRFNENFKYDRYFVIFKNFEIHSATGSPSTVKHENRLAK